MITEASSGIGWRPHARRKVVANAGAAPMLK
jgi:hypothetical protein